MSDLSALQVPLLSLTVFGPLLGALVLAMVPTQHTTLHRSVSLTVLAATFVLSLGVVAAFDPSVSNFQLTSVWENRAWLPAIGARYHVAIDGISLWLFVLTAFLGPVVVLGAWNSVNTRVREFHVALLVLQTAMLGALVAVDLLLFYLFWEMMLVPAYLLVGMWGRADRVAASLKMFLTTMLGSVLMLGAILYLYASAGFTSFGLHDLAAVVGSLSDEAQVAVFVAFAAGFLVKVPVIPAHTWLTDAHVQSVAAVSVLLVGIVEKGIYGLARFVIPMLPDPAYYFAPYMALAGVAAIAYALVIAYVQSDLKKMIAYASIGHAGMVLFGVFTMNVVGLTGALFQNFAHGIATAGLFLLIGMIEERRGTRELSELGGLAKRAPRMATAGVILAFAAAGVPGLLCFVGEFMILMGGAQSGALNFGGLAFFPGLNWGPEMTALAFTAVAGTGVILGALYLLRMVQAVFFGPLDESKNGAFTDLSVRETILLAPLVVLSVAIGLWPRPFLDRLEPSAAAVIETAQDGAEAFEPDVMADMRRSLDYSLWLFAEGSTTAWPIHAADEGSGHGQGDDHAVEPTAPADSAAH